jgi:hypothetical protein
MPDPVSLRFASAPAVIPAYLKILLARKPTSVTDSVPRIDAYLTRFTISRRHLARYRTVCGERNSAELPITYPHVLATPLHLAIIASDAFPVNLFGVIHLRNRIVQQRPLCVDDTGEIHSWLEGHRETVRGQELDLHTQLRVGDQTVWSETATLLARRQERVGSLVRESQVFPIWKCRRVRMSRPALSRWARRSGGVTRACRVISTLFTSRMSRPDSSGSNALLHMGCGQWRAAPPKSGVGLSLSLAPWMWLSSDPLRFALI